MTEDQEEKEPETPTTDPATTPAQKTKTETEGDAMMTEEEENKDEGTEEEAGHDPTAETASDKKDRRGMTQKTRASINQARIQASNLRNSKPTLRQSNNRDGRSNSTRTG